MGRQKGKVSKSMLSLSGLTEFEFDEAETKRLWALQKQEQEEYKAKYGNKWVEKYYRDIGLFDKPDYDDDMQSINTAIYYGAWVEMSGNAPIVAHITEMQEARMRELYGDRYNELRNHPERDSRVVNILLDDAVRTGKWKELPEELQDAYHERVGDNNID